MFGKTLLHSDNSRKNVTNIDDSAIFYQGSIIDEAQVVISSDGSSYRISDIALLKNLNSNSDTALAEALSMRMQIRQGSKDHKLKDTELFPLIKSRYAQDNVEIAGYNETIKKDIVDGIEDAEYREQVEKYIESKTASSETSDEGKTE